MIEYVETEISKIARDSFLRKAMPGSGNRRDYEEGRFNFDPEKKRNFLSSDGKIDGDKIYRTFMKNSSYPNDTLDRLCFQFNLDEKELNILIKARFKDCYGPDELTIGTDEVKSGRQRTKEYYPSWCKEWGIEPDSNFPDW